MNEILLKIIELREQHNLSWRKIGSKLNISHSRAYNMYHNFLEEKNNETLPYNDDKYNFVDEQELEEHRLKVIQSHQDKIAKKIKEETALMHIFSDYLTSNIESYNDSNFKIEIEAKDKGDLNREIVIHITDWHLGKKGNKYSSEIAKQSLNIIYNSIYQKAKDLRKLGFNVIGIKLMLGGDIVDGDLLYPGHPNFVDLNVYEQIGTGFSELRNMIIEMHQNIISNINIYHVYGNHGRISKFTNPTNNWDNILYMFLRTNINIKGINFHDGYNWYTLVPMLDGEKALLTHGDGLRMYQNIPMYGYVQAAMRWRGSIGDFKYSFIGHFHNPYFMRWNDMQLFINGQFPNDDSWALKTVKMESPPEQRMLVFSNEGIVDRNLIPLIS